MSEFFQHYPQLNYDISDELTVEVCLDWRTADI